MEQRVIELDLGVTPSPAGSSEFLLANESHCVVVFLTSGAGSVAVTEFVRCSQVVFGYPNDEAQGGHPLAAAAGARGWAYGVYEVVGSEWAGRLEAQNRVMFPTRTRRWEQRHFLVACHEDLVEVLADDVRVEVFHRNFADVARLALDRLLAESRD